MIATDAHSMKKVVIITDGEDLQAFRLMSHGGDHGLDFRSEEILGAFHGSKRRSSTLLRRAVFGEGEFEDGRAWKDGGPARNKRTRHSDAAGKTRVRYIARRIERIVRIEEPDLWNLVTPPDLADEVREALSMEVKERLTCVRMSDLIRITVDEVEDRFHSMGAGHS